VAEPIVITSLADPRIEVFRDVRDRDLRGRDGVFMAESELVIRRLLRTPRIVESLLLSPPRYQRMREDLAALPPQVPVFVADLPLMCRIAGFPVHRGALASGRRPGSEQLTLDGALGHLRQAAACRLLLAEGITNVDNMGGLFRNAAAFGLDGVVVDPTCCDPLYRKAIRVSMGHVLTVPYATPADWPEAIDRLRREWGLTLIAAETAPTAIPLAGAPRSQRLGVVVGSEGAGLAPATVSACDAICAIPMAEGVPSLNVACASAVFLYELSGRR
jgi:tRNA G18 (ribose-2'-O)-methylase SpoU